MENIYIDDQRLHVLTKKRKTKNGIDYSESDHNIINTRFKLTWSPNQRNVIEVFKYNDKMGKEKFKKVTIYTQQLSQIIDMNMPINIVTNKVLKRLKGFIHQCFSKVKIIDEPDKELESLYDKRRILRHIRYNTSKAELEVVKKE